jgi:hypothetical protein
MKVSHLQRPGFPRYFRESFRDIFQRLQMKLRVFPILVLLFGPISCAASGSSCAAFTNPQDSANRAYDVAAFGAELRRLDAALQGKPSANKIAKFRKALPSSWNVSAPERTYSISTKPLQDYLGASSTVKAEMWIEQLQLQIENSQRKPADFGNARLILDKILASREFEGVRPPSAWDLLRQRIAAWIERMLVKVFGGISHHPTGSEIFFWLLLIAGVAFVALWLFRFMSNRDGMNSFKPTSSIVTARTWQEWIRTARKAAARGDFREAVHSAYWAGIARLEETGALPCDRTKTPREYLRLVSASRSGEASPQHNCKEPLTALTSRLERIWYANRAASSEDFSDSLRQLGALGCPLE